MSAFPPIPPDHPLTEAARYVNAYSEEHGIERAVAWLDAEVDVGQLAYLSEQRALRAVAAAVLGVNLGGDTAVDQEVARRVQQMPLWRDMRMLLVACYMDGIAIGWKGRELANAGEQQTP